MGNNKKDLPKWGELTILERVLLVLSILIWVGSVAIYAVAFFKDNLKLDFFNYIMPIVGLSMFMFAYVYRSRKEIAIVCSLCGGFLIFMAVIFSFLFR